MEVKKLDFEKLTAQQIYDYMTEHATAEQKKKFKEAAFPTRTKKVSKKLFSADGQPKFDANGNPVMRQKIEMVEAAEGVSKPTFSLLNAKWWFADNFSEAVENVPERGKKEAPASKLFENW